MEGFKMTVPFIFFKLFPSNVTAQNEQRELELTSFLWCEHNTVQFQTNDWFRRAEIGKLR